MHKVLWDFEIQTDHLNSARRLNLVIVYQKRTCRQVDVAAPTDHRKRKERKLLGLCPRTEKAVEHGDVDISCNWCAQNDLQILIKGAVRAGNQ